LVQAVAVFNLSQDDAAGRAPHPVAPRR